MAHITYGNTVLLHGLKQSRLCLGRSTVYFVRKNDVCKNRTGLKSECGTIVVLDHYVCTCDITGHKVRCELNPLK